MINGPLLTCFSLSVLEAEGMLTSGGEKYKPPYPVVIYK